MLTINQLTASFIRMLPRKPYLYIRIRIRLRFPWYYSIVYPIKSQFREKINKNLSLAAKELDKLQVSASSGLNKVAQYYTDEQTETDQTQKQTQTLDRYQQQTQIEPDQPTDPEQIEQDKRHSLPRPPR